MVTAMLVNFWLMCMTLISIPRVNPAMATHIAVFRNRPLQLMLGWTGVVLLTGFLIVHIWKDMSSQVSAWYFHSTLVWLLVMALGSVVFFVKFASLRRKGVDTDQLFSSLPE